MANVFSVNGENEFGVAEIDLDTFLANSLFGNTGGLAKSILIWRFDDGTDVDVLRYDSPAWIWRKESSWVANSLLFLALRGWAAKLH